VVRRAPDAARRRGGGGAVRLRHRALAMARAHR